MTSFVIFVNNSGRCPYCHLSLMKNSEYQLHLLNLSAAEEATEKSHRPLAALTCLVFNSLHGPYRRPENRMSFPLIEPSSPARTGIKRCLDLASPNCQQHRKCTFCARLYCVLRGLAEWKVMG